MGKSRLGPEAKIINLFLSLSDEGKRIVLDVIRSQSATPRKVATTRAPKEPKAAKEPTADKEPLCGACGNIEDYQDHFKPSPNYHKFDGPKPARAKRGAKAAAPTLIPVEGQGVEGNGLAAEMES